MIAAQNVYRMSTDRGRQAQAREAAESAIVLGGTAFASNGVTRHGAEALPNDVRATWEITATQGDRATIRAEGAVGLGNDRVEVHMTAEVERTAGSRRPLVLRVTRQ
jgi:hypothetical protein